MSSADESGEDLGKDWVTHAEMLVQICCSAVVASAEGLQFEGLKLTLTLIKFFEKTVAPRANLIGGSSGAGGGGGGSSTEEYEVNDDMNDIEDVPRLQQYEAQLGSAVRKCFRSDKASPLSVML